MRITITTGGSRGDTQPFVALGRGLSSAGHEVTVATHAPYEDFVRGGGLNFHPVFGDPEADMEHLTGDGAAPGPLEFARRNRDNMRRTLGPMFLDYKDACRDADAVLYTYPGFMGNFAGRELGKPVIGAFVEPFSEPTTAFQSALLPEVPSPFRDLPGGRILESAYNRASHALMGQLFWQFLRRPVNEALVGAGAERVPFRGPFKRSRDERVPAVYGFSPQVRPTPRDWGEHLAVTGFWFLDEPYEPEADNPVAGTRGGPQDGKDYRVPNGLENLERFLSRHDDRPVVSIGFGSTVESDPAALAELVTGAVSEAGVRAVIVDSWAGMRAASSSGVLDSEEVYIVEETPYTHLFPRVDAAVHHGGAGTTAEAFRAGIPQVVVPSYHGQPFWASTVHRSGAGPEPVHRKNLTPQALAAAIHQAVSSASLREAASNIGKRVRVENGVENAVHSIERFLKGL